MPKKNFWSALTQAAGVADAPATPPSACHVRIMAFVTGSGGLCSRPVSLSCVQGHDWHGVDMRSEKLI